MKGNIIYLVFMAMMLAACSEDGLVKSSAWNPSLTARYLHVSSYDVTLDASGSTQVVKVDALTTPWHITGQESWLSISPTEGSDDANVQISAAPNLSGEEVRTSVFTLASVAGDYEYSKQISVTQAAATPVLNVDKTNVNVGVQGETVVVGVEANINYTVSVSDGSWLSAEASADGSKVTIKANANAEAEQRTGNVTLNGVKTVVIKVTQNAAGIDIDGMETIIAPNAGGVYPLKISSDAAWTVKTGGETWLDITPNEGTSGVTNAVLSVAPNRSTSDRSATIQFCIGTKSLLSIKVEQEGIYFSATPTTLTFGADECTRIVDIQCNTAWQLLSKKPEWITLSQLSGEGSATLSFTATNYNELTDRNGDVMIGVEGVTGLQQTISFVQEGRSIAPISELRFDAIGGTKDLNVESDGQWTLSTNNTWISIGTTSGSGNTTVPITVAENTSDNERRGAIDITVGSTTLQAAVIQKGHYFTIDPTSLAELPSTGGTHTVSIQTDDSWTVNNSASWLTLSADRGTGDIDISITAADNPSINSRQQYVTFSPTNVQEIKVSVSQKARYLTVDNSLITFFGYGGVSDPIAVTTDGTFEVTTSVSWLTVNRSENTFTVSASANDGEESREGTVSVALTGLVTGESYAVQIPVKQYVDKNINVDLFPDDDDWNVIGESDFSVSIGLFPADEDWNVSGDASFTVTKTGFADDEEWKTGNDSHMNVDVDVFGNDDEWKNGNNSSMDVDIDGFGNDENWNF